MNLSLQDKNALVGGSTQGIGKATAIELALLGATVTLLARNESALQATCAELPTPFNQKHQYIVGDFSQPEALQQKVATYMASHQIVYHLLINTTGGPKGGPIHQANYTEFEAAMAMHLICNHLLVQTVLPGMKLANYGRIVNITSTSVKEPIEGLGVSNTTRWAVAAWAKTLAGEVAAWGITVNTVLPGFTETDRLQQIINTNAQKKQTTTAEMENFMRSVVPAGRFAAPHEIAAAVAFLGSPAAGYINGIVLPVDGGRTKSL